MERLTLKNAYYYSALVYVFLIPFHQKAASFALILWVILSLVRVDKKQLVKNKSLLILPGFYLLYAIGLFITETPRFELLETKLSLLVFPVLFFLQPYQEKQRNKLLQYFVFGLASSCFVCLAFANYNAFNFQEGTIFFQANVLPNKGFMESIIYGGNYFFGSQLSLFHQTVYFALYLCSGIAIVLFHPNLFKPKLRYTVLGILVIFIFLVSNKASFIALALVLTIRVISSKINPIKKLIGGILILGVVVAFAIINPRAKESLNKISSGDLKINKDARYGFSTRILSWDAALTLIKKKPILGYGASRAQQQLNQVYADKEYKHPLKENFNAHNLWLQTWIENGLIGIFLLGIIFFLLFKNGFKDQSQIGYVLAMVTVLFVNSLFESMFHRFSGLSFFSFIACFLLTRIKRKAEA